MLDDLLPQHHRPARLALSIVFLPPQLDADLGPTCQAWPRVRK